MSSRLAFLTIAIGCTLLADATSDPRVQRGELLLGQGRFVEAAAQYQAVYEEANQAGVPDERLAAAAIALGSIYISLDRYRESEVLLKQALDLYARLFGADSPQTARHSVTLAKLYTMQHRLAEAEQILTRARPIVERAYGTDSRLMGSVFNDLGLTEEALGRMKRAAAYYRQAIAIYTKMGESHQGLTAMVMVNLAEVLADDDQIEEAAEMAGAALHLLEHAFGPEHPFTARALHGLGRVRQVQNRIEEARDLYERALAPSQFIGVLQTASVQASLGSIYTESGHYPKAEALLKQALATREGVFGPDSPENIGALNNLGVLYAHQRRWSDAIQVLERAAAIAQTGPVNPSLAVPILSNLAATYYVEGRYRKDRYAKAEALFRRALSIQEARFGPDHLQVANVLVNLAQTCAAEKNYREAKQLEGRAVAIRRAVLGPKHPDTLQALKQYTFLLRKSE